MKYLKQDNTILPVSDLYPYRHDYGKGRTVLRMQIPGSVAFADIQAFFSAVGDYDYYDDADGAETLKTTYTQYGADLDIHYKAPVDTTNPDGTVTQTAPYYDIEVMRDPAVEAEVRRLMADNTALKARADQLSINNMILSARADDAELMLADALYGNTDAQDIAALDSRATDIEALMAEILYGEPTTNNESTGGTEA